MGHVISGQGVSTDPSMIEVVANWPVPTTVSELRSFLGFASYYQRFVEGFAKLAAPLHKTVAGFCHTQAGRASERGVIKCRVSKHVRPSSPLPLCSLMQIFPSLLF